MAVNGPVPTAGSWRADDVLEENFLRGNAHLGQVESDMVILARPESIRVGTSVGGLLVSDSNSTHIHCIRVQSTMLTCGLNTFAKEKKIK